MAETVKDAKTECNAPWLRWATCGDALACTETMEGLDRRLFSSRFEIRILLKIYLINCFLASKHT